VNAGRAGSPLPAVGIDVIGTHGVTRPTIADGPSGRGYNSGETIFAVRSFKIEGSIRAA
jgi:hypothetical protein